MPHDPFTHRREIASSAGTNSYPMVLKRKSTPSPRLLELQECRHGQDQQPSEPHRANY